MNLMASSSLNLNFEGVTVFCNCAQAYIYLAEYHVMLMDSEGERHCDTAMRSKSRSKMSKLLGSSALVGLLYTPSHHSEYMVLLRDFEKSLFAIPCGM